MAARPGPKPRSLVGRNLGKLKVLGEGGGRLRGDGRRIRTWLCRCECGNPEEVEVRGPDLTSGHTTSCGCARTERPGGRPPKTQGKPVGYLRVLPPIREASLPPATPTAPARPRSRDAARMD